MMKSLTSTKSAKNPSGAPACVAGDVANHAVIRRPLEPRGTCAPHFRELRMLYLFLRASHSVSRFSSYRAAAYRSHRNAHTKNQRMVDEARGRESARSFANRRQLNFHSSCMQPKPAGLADAKLGLKFTDRDLRAISPNAPDEEFRRFTPELMLGEFDGG